MSDEPIYESSYETEPGLGARLLSKAHRNPFLVIGICGFLGTVGVGAYKFTKRPPGQPISLFLIQLRVAAQSAVIGSLTVGMTYGMLNEYVFNPKPKSKSLH